MKTLPSFILLFLVMLPAAVVLGQSTGGDLVTELEAKAAVVRAQATELRTRADLLRKKTPGWSSRIGGRAFSFVQETPQLRALEKQLQAATSQLSKADTDQDKAAATQEIRDTLGKIYSARLDAYDQHIEKLQEKLQKMKQQLDKRRAAKDELVELRLKMIEAKASGLGWPDGQLPPSFQTFWGDSASLEEPAFLPTPDAPDLFGRPLRQPVVPSQESN